jgi:thymidylate synthase (FAD)
MDVWRQWIRHRTANVNEYSTRYSLAIDATSRTASGAWRSQGESNRQGSGEPLPPELGAILSEEEAQLHEHCKSVYNSRIERGVAREQARKDLPLSTYTEAYWKVDLHNLLRFLALRMDEHAQWEIREYANTIGREIVSRWTPLTWEAFEDYQLGATSLSRDAKELLGKLVRGEREAALEYAASRQLATREDEAGGWKLSREARELETLLQSLGLPSPWK